MRQRFLIVALGLSAMCTTAKADFTFDTIAPFGPGFPPIVVDSNNPPTVSLNDAINSAGVPLETFRAFRVSAEWAAGPGDPWSNEARLNFTFNGSSTSLFAPLTGSGSNGNTTSLFWEYNLGGIYDVSASSQFDITMYQTYSGSSANWSQIVVEILNNELTADPPATDGSLTTGGVGTDSLSYNYDATTGQNVYWTQYDLTEAADFVTFDTLGSTGIDTEIGVFDAAGNLLGNNDDFAGSLLSSLTLSDLTAGTYYIATGGYNTSFADLFNVSSNDTADIGTLFVNVNAFSAVPEPSSAMLIGIGALGLAFARRRRVE